MAWSGALALLYLLYLAWLVGRSVTVIRSFGVPERFVFSTHVVVLLATLFGLTLGAVYSVDISDALSFMLFNALYNGYVYVLAYLYTPLNYEAVAADDGDAVAVDAVTGPTITRGGAPPARGTAAAGSSDGDDGAGAGTGVGVVVVPAGAGGGSDDAGDEDNEAAAGGRGRRAPRVAFAGGVVGEEADDAVFVVGSEHDDDDTDDGGGAAAATVVGEGTGAEPSPASNVAAVAAARAAALAAAAPVEDDDIVVVADEDVAPAAGAP